ncbi:hypothetical protein [Bosea sp. NBC_00550]|uniref:hypothetical protein n=1 Tax=Bosea sp. NBC_00550 TaxID=2969621 RepID=UPI0022302631|nr:hypothetical protein [Bosea sp. NBC_00550]UZF90881.1 hypothetical protein NWE53_17265 [Bosea sp. NBC_00550]
MFQDEFTMPPRDEEHFWELMEQNFSFAMDTLRLRLQSREEARLAKKTNQNSQLLIRYSAASVENDQREHYYDLGRGLLDRVWELIKKRELSPEFIQLWGVLMFSFGHTVNYQMDDNPVLEAVRAASAPRQALNLQKKWLARVMVEKASVRANRRDAEDHAISLIERIIRQGGVGNFPAVWFELMLDEENPKMLRSMFQQNNFPHAAMVRICENKTDGLPPTDESSLFSG